MVVSRRKFIQSSRAVVVYFSLAGCDKADGPVATETYDNRISVYPDGRVELLMGKVELGQGIGTALAQIAADELGVEFEQVRLMTVDTHFSPDESYTFSSISIQQSGPRVRVAAAKARGYLRQVTGDESGVATSSVGKSKQRIDIPGKVFGDVCFVQDHRIKNMVHARVLRPPAERAVIKSMDSESVEGMPGVIAVVRDGNFVGIIADREGQARKAAAALKSQIQWSVPMDLPISDQIHDWLTNAPARTEEVLAEGSVGIIPPDATVRRATYQRPCQAHASISPSAAVALFVDSKLTVWSHAQGMYPLRSAVAFALGLPAEDVRCVHMEASGCYGHNGADDAACDAAALAVKLPGRPVRLQWERSDEFLWEPLGPAMQIEVQAVLDERGRISNWHRLLNGAPAEIRTPDHLVRSHGCQKRFSN